MKRPLPVSGIGAARSGAPAYPCWAQGPLHPELAGTRAAEFDLARLELWRPPPGNLRRLRTGDWVYCQLKKADLLERCLGLCDLVEIKHQGLRYYRRHFGSRTVFGWRSVVRDRLGFLYVPYLFEFGDGVEVHWFLLEFAWARTTAWLFQRQASPVRAKALLVQRTKPTLRG
jgi:hypothetical protein